jgi:hypothetical protein
MMAPMNADFLEERMNEFEEFLNSVQDAKEQSIVGFEIFGTRAILSVKQDETAFADRGKHATVRIIPTYTEQQYDTVCKDWSLDMGEKFQREFERAQHKTQTWMR